MQVNYPGRHRQQFLGLQAEINAALIELIGEKVVQLLTVFSQNGARLTSRELLANLINLTLKHGHVKCDVIRY